MYFFSPALQPASTLFLVLQRGVALFDMQKDINVDWSLLNRAVIGCLLMQFGFYPPAPYEKALARIEGLLSMTVDFMQSQNLELLTSLAATLALHDLAEYDAWLLASISTHPRIGGFKTLPFVYKTMQRGYLGHKS
ncbi:hypothetical protein EBZ39_16945 [bacterium]|nr:hypothetical protein [bacterium]